MTDFDTDDKIFKALASTFRRDLLDALRDNPRTTGELCEIFSDVNRCTVMQHLTVLEKADLLIVKRDGRQRWNYLNAIPIKRIHDRWIGSYAAEAVTMLNRLKSELEADKPMQTYY